MSLSFYTDGIKNRCNQGNWLFRNEKLKRIRGLREVYDGGGCCCIWKGGDVWGIVVILMEVGELLETSKADHTWWHHKTVKWSFRNLNFDLNLTIFLSSINYDPEWSWIPIKIFALRIFLPPCPRHTTYTQPPGKGYENWIFKVFEI